MNTAYTKHTADSEAKALARAAIYATLKPNDRVLSFPSYVPHDINCQLQRGIKPVNMYFVDKDARVLKSGIAKVKKDLSKAHRFVGYLAEAAEVWSGEKINLAYCDLMGTMKETPKGQHSVQDEIGLFLASDCWEAKPVFRLGVTYMAGRDGWARDKDRDTVLSIAVENGLRARGGDEKVIKMLKYDYQSKSAHSNGSPMRLRIFYIGHKNGGKS